jgi:hypothetical protein
VTRILAFAFGLVAVASLGPGSSVGAATTPTITLSAASGSVGTPVTITGSGFPANEIVALYIDSPALFIGTPGPRADAQGSFTQKITWPGSDYDITRRVDPSKPGPHRVCGDTSYPGITPAAEAQACTEFLVLAGPSPSPSPVASSPPAKPAGAPFPVGLVVAFAVIAVVAIGAVVWLRRSP